MISAGLVPQPQVTMEELRKLIADFMYVADKRTTRYDELIRAVLKRVGAEGMVKE
jgi:hypothetical protein